MTQGSPTGRIRRRGLLAAGVALSLTLAGSRRAGAWPMLDEDDAGWGGAEGGRRPSPVAGPQPVAAPASAAAPTFSEVATVEPWDGLLFLAGKSPRYAGATIESIMGYSPADIIETTDTVVVDAVHANRGAPALGMLYGMIAVEVLEALLAVHGGAPVLLALDAGHGGRRGVYYDPGSNGTEAEHARRVVLAVEELADGPRYESITIRRIFNDAIGDDFGLPPPEDRKSAAALTLRNIRAAMLAAEVDTWNRAHPEAAVALHVLSVHFNAGSGGILVLHQGSTVRREFRERSIAYAAAYVASARPVLNRSGLLPYQLALALGSGLSDDRVLYEPMMRIPSRINPYTGADRTSFPRRYAMLQTSLLQRDYALGALLYHRLL